MKPSTQMILTQLIERYPTLASIKSEIETAYEQLISCFEAGNRVYLCGNGGSAADCEHMAGELLKCFKIPRPMPDDLRAKLSEYGEDGEVLANNLEGGLPVVSLTGHVAFSTAFQNDNTPALVFAQQVNAYGREGDVLVVFSTSGNSKNCIYATICAKAKGMKVITLTGGTGGKLAPMSDVAIVVPAKETYQVQELHLPVYHCLCAMLEEQVFGK
ncbi:MAG: SIS domain-containing protein [Clostridia bacterium]|nr:SIS domain-containing protein [Clostridia bacterium]